MNERVELNRAQITTLWHLAEVFGDAVVRPHEDPLLDWIWATTKTQDWCINDKGDVIGFNDLPREEPVSS